MDRIATNIARPLKSALLALTAATALSTVAASASAQDTHRDAQMQVQVTVLSTCSIASGSGQSAGEGQVDVACAGTAEPMVETSAPLALRDGAGSVAITTLSF